MISGFGGEWSLDDGMGGDAFVVAPDNSRCGLVWDVGGDDAEFKEVFAPDTNHWGVWAVNFEWPMTSRESARKNLNAITEELKLRWTAWLKARAKCEDFSFRSK